MVDIAGFAANAFKPADYGNVLATAQYLTDAKQRNELRAFDLEGARSERNALASGDVNALAKINPQAAGQYQGVMTEQRKQAVETFVRAMDAVGKSKSPRALAAQVLAMPDFQGALSQLQIDPSQFTIDDTDTDDSLRAQATDLGRAFGEIPSMLENTDIPSNWRLYNAYRGLPEDERALYSEANRAPTVRNVEGVETVVGPGGAGTSVGGSTLEGEANAASVLANAKASGTAEVIPADEREAARNKLPRARAAKRRLDRVAAAVEGLADNMILTGGRFQSGVLSVTKEGRELEQAAAQLLPELTALTRVPGVGSQSDLEQRLAGLVMPSAEFEPEINRKAIEELDVFMDDLESAYQNISKGKADTGKEAAPADNDPLGIRK
jgi:hypothetical protein